jgi:hypothetical protein
MLHFAAKSDGQMRRERAALWLLRACCRQTEIWFPSGVQRYGFMRRKRRPVRIDQCALISAFVICLPVVESIIFPFS